MTSYAIRGGAEGKRRLDLLAQIMAPTTDALLRQVGVRDGMRCLDLGCGAGHVSLSLATLVGGRGSVLGLDLDSVKLDAARTDCERSGWHNVEFRAGDARDWAPSPEFDLVYGRFILSHLPDRAAVVARMRDALKPGGMLVLEDVDFEGSFCHPPNAAYRQYCDLYREVVRKRGGDADLGPQLYGLCLDAGFDGVVTRVVQPAHSGIEPEKRLALSTLVNIGESVLADGLATPGELDATVAELTSFTDDPRSVIGLPRVFQVWGRKPS